MSMPFSYKDEAITLLQKQTTDIFSIYISLNATSIPHLCTQKLNSFTDNKIFLLSILNRNYWLAPSVTILYRNIFTLHINVILTSHKTVIPLVSTENILLTIYWTFICSRGLLKTMNKLLFFFLVYKPNNNMKMVNNKITKVTTVCRKCIFNYNF